MRRPMLTYEERIANAIANPARRTRAGALVPSALPVPRQRIPRLIGGGAPVVMSATYVGSDTDSSAPAATTWTIGHASPLADGDTVVWAASKIGEAITPPAGWTTLASGVVTDLHYLICWTVKSAGTSWTATLAGAGGYGIGRTWKFRDLVNCEPVLFGAVEETTGTHTYNLPDYPDPAANAWQVMGYQPDTTVAYSYDFTDPGSNATFAGTISTHVSELGVMPYDAAYPAYGGVLPTTEAFSIYETAGFPSTPVNGEWWRVGIGLA